MELNTESRGPVPLLQAIGVCIFVPLLMGAWLCIPIYVHWWLWYLTGLAPVPEFTQAFAIAAGIGAIRPLYVYALKT